MNPGTVFLCDKNGVILHVCRDDFRVFGSPDSGEHLSRYVEPSSKEAATGFFAALSSVGLSASRPIEFITHTSSVSLFCTGMRIRNCFLVFGSPDLSGLSALISGTLYSDEVPVDLSLICGNDVSHEIRALPDYQIYEDLTRLNNELVNMSRQLTDTQVELEMEADERNREILVRKQTEQTLSITNKKLNLLSSITRHDIKNQMMGLQTYLLILKNKETDPALAGYLGEAESAAKRISSIIAFTKEYESIGITAPLWQDCRTLVETAVKQAPLGRVTVKNDLPSSAEIFADPLIVKVFYTLMENAVRHGGKITTIRFFVEGSDGNHILVCEDNGDGVAREEKEQIFERGFGKNTGLGLFLSREILSITGITITESGKPGRGARFEIMMPKGAYRFDNISTEITEKR